MRPAVLVDVDGVLNPWFKCNPPYCSHHRGWVRARSARTREKLVLNPLHGPWLLQLAALFDAELAWCTSWEEEANLEVGPRVGLPPLPVVPWPPMPREHQDAGMPTGVWKARHAAPWLAGRPAVWFEDQPAAPAEMARLATGPVKVVLTHSWEGLTMEHVEEARVFLETVCGRA